jgi:hypothetical protein
VSDADAPIERARLLWIIAALPIVVVTGRAIARGWLPVGDNAFFAIRARDVLTEHHPVVGAWSSGSLTVDVNVNNLGPLQLDLLALPAKIDWTAGTAVGVAAVNVAAIVLACVFARRVAGTLASLVVAAGAAGLTWSLGELVYEPRQHHALVLPSFAYWVLAWAVASGHVRALPWAVLAGSFVLQTHLSYAVLVPLMGVFALLALGFSLRRDRASEAAAWAARRSEAARWAAVAGAVAALCWAQPIADQLFGRGNMSSVVRAAQVEQETAGVAHGARALATVAAHPPWWFSPSFRDFDPKVTVVSGGRAWLTLGILALALAGAGLLARRVGDRVGLVGVFASVVLLCGATLAGASQSTEPPFGLVAGNYRWLWSSSVFVWAVIGLVVLRAVARSVTAQRRAVVGTGLVLATFALLALLPAATADIVADDERLMPVARDLVDQLGPLEGRGPVLVERSDLFFREPYTYVLMAGLQDRGIDWRVGGNDALRYGDRRGRTDDVEGIVRLASGDRAIEPSPGEERIALATLFSEREQRELFELREATAPTPEEAERLRQLESRWYQEMVAVMYEPAGTGR